MTIAGRAKVLTHGRQEGAARRMSPGTPGAPLNSGGTS